jgi:hypothetical protein
MVGPESDPEQAPPDDEWPEGNGEQGFAPD